MISKREKSGMTLVEVLIAISLFAIVSIISSNILIDIVHLEKKSSLQNAIYEDLRMVLQQLTKEIQNGAIDYEEYYSYYVLQNGDENGNNGIYYGINYGIYGSRFYDPGNSLNGEATFNPDDIGIECSFMGPDECEVVYNLSVDLNTGQNPFIGDQNDANAFCDHNIGNCGDPMEPIRHLFLIDSTGTTKTIIAPKSIDGGRSLGMIRLEGKDIDQNGINDIFSCPLEFNCEEDIARNVIQWPAELEAKLEDIRLANSGDLQVQFDLSTNNSYFVPITPLRSSVEAEFIIHPLEDPYKAYAETAAQSHPSVTIILTVDLNENIKADYPGEFKPITIRTTVAAGILNRIDSYPSINDITDPNDPTDRGWIYATIENQYGLYPDLKVP